MTSKFSIDNRELLQRISSGEAVVGIDFGNLIVRELAVFRLAAMDSEPVVKLPQVEQIEQFGDGWDSYHEEYYLAEDVRTALTTACVKWCSADGESQPAPVVLKDHQIRELVNQLRDIAIEYHGTQQLRERIAQAVRAATLAAAPQSPGSEPATVPGKWIPVSERMPENDVPVLTFDGMYKRVHHAMYGHWQCWEPEKITHWMPLPAAPQEVNRE